MLNICAIIGRVASSRVISAAHEVWLKKIATANVTIAGFFQAPFPPRRDSKASTMSAAARLPAAKACKASLYKDRKDVRLEFRITGTLEY